MGDGRWEMGDGRWRPFSEEVGRVSPLTAVVRVTFDFRIRKRCSLSEEVGRVSPLTAVVRVRFEFRIRKRCADREKGRRTPRLGGEMPDGEER